jgi:hypothetical protein
MSYHGKQYKGAAKARRELKREEAELRNATSDARSCWCGNRHGSKWDCPHKRRFSYDPAQELLKEIFTGETHPA